jgi:hypothetical protein
MKSLIQKSLILSVVLIACAGVSITSQAASYTFVMNTEFGTPSGSPTVEGSVTATFADDSSVANGVDLTLSVSGLAFSYYNVNTIWFDVASTYANTLSASVIPADTIGTFTAGTLGQSSTKSSQVDGSGDYFNTWLNTWASFENGDSVTYLLTSSVTGLSAADFDETDSSGTYNAATWINAMASEQYELFYLGATGGSSSVPEAGNTAILLGLALIGLAGMTRKMRTV